MAKKKKSYRRRRATGVKGIINKVLPGVVTGAVQSLIPNDALGGFADSLVPLGVGYFMKNDTLVTLGAYEVGLKLASNIGAPKGSVGSFGQVR